MSLRSLFLFLQGPSLAFTHHWGSEKGRTSRQVCKGGGKLVFSQGSTHTGREPMLPVLTHEFRNHSDVWFVRHRVGRGVLFVNRNYDLPLARHGHRKSSPPRPAKKTNGLHAWNLGFFTFFFFKHLSPAVWLKTPWHPLVYYSLVLRLCLSQLCPFEILPWRTHRIPPPPKPGQIPISPFRNILQIILLLAGTVHL